MFFYIEEQINDCIGFGGRGTQNFEDLKCEVNIVF